MAWVTAVIGLQAYTAGIILNSWAGAFLGTIYTRLAGSPGLHL